MHVAEYSKNALRLVLHIFQQRAYAERMSLNINFGCGDTHEVAVSKFFRSIAMNKDQVNGRLEQAKGKVEEVAGKVIHNDRLKVEGKADQVSGKVQAQFGDAKAAVKDKAKHIVDKI